MTAGLIILSSSSPKSPPSPQWGLRFRWETTPAAILAMVQQSKADVVLLRSAKELTPQRCESVVECMKQAGFRTVDRADLPPTCDEVQVLLRDHRSAYTVLAPLRR